MAEKAELFPTIWLPVIRKGEQFTKFVAVSAVRSCDFTGTRGERFYP
jgi:hypothetical protein